jgi:hypothetical protein
MGVRGLWCGGGSAAALLVSLCSVMNHPRRKLSTRPTLEVKQRTRLPLGQYGGVNRRGKSVHHNLAKLGCSARLGRVLLWYSATLCPPLP